MTHRSAAVAACAILALCACTEEPQKKAEHADESPVSTAVRCEESDAVGPPPDGQRLADGVVVAGTYAPERSGRADGLLFAKGGLWVRDSPTVRLAVVDPATALVGWGKPGRPARELAVPACAGPGWRVWPGGFYVSEPTCVRLRVQTPKGSAEARVPIGAICG